MSIIYGGYEWIEITTISEYERGIRTFVRGEATGKVRDVHVPAPIMLATPETVMLSYSEDTK